LFIFRQGTERGRSLRSQTPHLSLRKNEGKDGGPGDCRQGFTTNKGFFVDGNDMALHGGNLRQLAWRWHGPSEYDGRLYVFAWPCQRSQAMQIRCNRKLPSLG
jgi:hypothetical protein